VEFPLCSLDGGYLINTTLDEADDPNMLVLSWNPEARQ
jgi:hypothetical protein